MRQLIFIILTTVVSQATLAQEVLIVGAMHTVPKIAKNSYKPMLKIAKQYAPALIMVEEVMAQDSVSQAFEASFSKGYSYFFALSDSLRKTNEIPASINFNNNTTEEIMQYFALSRNIASYNLYEYIKQYGSEGSKKPLRNESYDLNFKLALALKQTQLYGIDNHHYETLYQKAIRDAWREGQKNGNVQAYIKSDKKTRNRAVWAVLGGYLGRCVNNAKHLQLLHNINSFECAVNTTEKTIAVSQLWTARNAAIAQNIAKTVRTNGKTKNIVIIGAGHVLGVKAELEKQYPEIKVKLINEL